MYTIDYFYPIFYIFNISKKANNKNKYIVYILCETKIKSIPSTRALEDDDISGSLTRCHIQELRHHLVRFRDKVLFYFFIFFIFVLPFLFFNYCPFNFQLHIQTNTGRGRNLIAENSWGEFQDENVICVPSSCSG